jgi:hypothetical protein
MTHVVQVPLMSPILSFRTTFHRYATRIHRHIT